MIFLLETMILLFIEDLSIIFSIKIRNRIDYTGQLHIQCPLALLPTIVKLIENGKVRDI